MVCDTRRPVLGTPPYQLCPADCGQTFVPERDCIQCKCGPIGEPGDLQVNFHEPCPPGYDHRVNGAFFKACGPIDDLRKQQTARRAATALCSPLSLALHLQTIP